MSKFTEVLEESKKQTFSDKVKEQLDEDSYKDFVSALNNPAVSCAAIQRALKSLGVTTSAMTIQRMRDSL